MFTTCKLKPLPTKKNGKKQQNEWKNTIHSVCCFNENKHQNVKKLCHYKKLMSVGEALGYTSSMKARSVSFNVSVLA
uniref:Ovule protein n=1 Tax=Panagrellus redivivus TaxID=6233 RepID=A0A7E4WBI5_PANRE